MPWLTIVLYACLPPAVVCAETVQIVTFDYPPVMDSSRSNGGLMEEIVRAAFRKVNIESDFVYYPAKRMLLYYIGTETFAACIGPIGLVDRQPEEKRQQVIRVPPLVDILMVFAYYKPNHGSKPTVYQQLSELHALRVGTILGSNTIPLLRQAGIDIVETRLESQIKLLMANRIDFAVVGLLTGLDMITRLFPGRKHEFAFIRKPIMELPT